MVPTFLPVGDGQVNALLLLVGKRDGGQYKLEWLPGVTPAVTFIDAEVFEQLIPGLEEDGFAALPYDGHPLGALVNLRALGRVQLYSPDPIFRHHGYEKKTVVPQETPQSPERLLRGTPFSGAPKPYETDDLSKPIVHSIDVPPTTRFFRAGQTSPFLDLKGDHTACLRKKVKPGVAAPGAATVTVTETEPTPVTDPAPAGTGLLSRVRKGKK